MPSVRTTAFTRGDYSFRPIFLNGRPGFNVFRKGDRSFWSNEASLQLASDGHCWIVSPRMQCADARPSFKEACDLVMAHMPLGGRA